jgi:hypothetical protein
MISTQPSEKGLFFVIMLIKQVIGSIKEKKDLIRKLEENRKNNGERSAMYGER